MSNKILPRDPKEAQYLQDESIKIAVSIETRIKEKEVKIKVHKLEVEEIDSPVLK